MIKWSSRTCERFSRTCERFSFSRLKSSLKFYRLTTRKIQFPRNFEQFVTCQIKFAYKHWKFVVQEIKSVRKLIHLRYTNLNTLFSFGIINHISLYLEHMSLILEIWHFWNSKHFWNSQCWYFRLPTTIVANF